MRNFNFLISIAFFDLIFFRESKTIKTKTIELKTIKTACASAKTKTTCANAIELKTIETICASAKIKTACANATIITIAKTWKILIDDLETIKTICKNYSFWLFVAETIKLFATFVFVDVSTLKTLFATFVFVNVLKIILNVEKKALYIDKKIVIFAVDNNFAKKFKSTKFFK